MPKLKHIKSCKPQGDRYLKRLNRYERGKQELLRGTIVNDRYLANV